MSLSATSMLLMNFEYGDCPAEPMPEGMSQRSISMNGRRALR